MNAPTRQPVAPPAATLDLIVNGEPVAARATTLATLLVELGYAGAKLATARNGDFVPERTRGTTTLAPGDRIEIVAPRQGG